MEVNYLLVVLFEKVMDQIFMIRQLDIYLFILFYLFSYNKKLFVQNEAVRFIILYWSERFWCMKILTDTGTMQF